jgi:hypothetical protein
MVTNVFGEVDDSHASLTELTLDSITVTNGAAESLGRYCHGRPVRSFLV